MDLSTTYLKLKLRNPLVASASPLSEHVENFKKLEDAGIGAIVMHSLFEEQLNRDEAELRYGVELGTESYAEALTHFPMSDDYHVGPEQYLQNIEKAKKLVKVPIIGSLNGTSAGGWLKYAKNIENAGADAIELNIYHIPTNPLVSSVEIEQLCLDIVGLVKSETKLPVAVKLSPYFGAMANLAQKLEGVGADGLVLFNRFYQPDIDVEDLEVRPKVVLSTPYEMCLPLRWIAILRGEVEMSLAGTSGIHDAEAVVKMLLAGADATMMCSALLRKGTGHVAEVLKGVESWMREHEYASVEEIKGLLSQRSVASPEAFERANYLKTLQSYR